VGVGLSGANSVALIDKRVMRAYHIAKKEEIAMKVDVKCFATLADAEACDYTDVTEYSISEGDTVDSLIDRLDIAKEEIKIVFLNNKVVDLDTPLHDGDRLGFAPAVGAM
jgi:molybdopterin converting factor small subunit